MGNEEELRSELARLRLTIPLTTIAGYQIPGSGTDAERIAALEAMVYALREALLTIQGQIDSLSDRR